MMGRRLGGWKTHLFLFATCVLLITDVARGSEPDDVMAVEGSSDGETGGGSGGGEEEALRAAVEAEPRGGGGGGGETTRRGDEGGVVVVENGTVEAVVLDCPFHLEDKDMEGIHINWFHSSDHKPIYLWIPEKEPKLYGFLEGRVDLSYEASPEALHRHRALRILEPTTDVDGRYVCRVSTFTKELKYKQELIVFSGPRDVEVMAEEREEGQVAVICRVDEIYPQPVLYLYKKSHVKDSEVLSGGTPIISSSHGTYNMEVEKVLQEATLDGPTDFECHATIPNTTIRVVASTKYQPRISVTTGAVIAGTSTQQASAVLLAVLSLLSLSLLCV
ncbi:uncharacterized protein LOC126980383 [Eriocheir sinensis]|uniref:uncharacterized protein LOC126980383 n=1 Tax=Eriocheir sinensis TaxID=95602 RepID=UPI0021C73025|nr:uncharacterized protein LOC126980383 [Eriocheir sinensis]XP_050686205.1 uncharacterized protein LOC126980383 [Eriocheir sinensis]